MKQPKRKILNLTKRDIGLVIGIGTLAAILNVYPYPFIAAAAVVIGILLLRLTETREEIEPETVEKSVPESHPETTVEQKSAQEIITEKLNGGIIEKAIEEQFGKTVNKVVSDLFGIHGDITREIQKRLKETMSPYIEQYDFGKYNVKLEHFLNELVTNVTNDQGRIIKNVKEIMGVEPVKEVKTSELFDKYTEFISGAIATEKLEIDEDDTPRYVPLNAHLQTLDKRSYGSSSERKVISFTCEEDEELNLSVVIHRWTDSILGNDWTIESIERPTSDGKTIYAFQIQSGKQDITSLELPMSNLRDLTDLEVYLLKLHYDHTAVIIDETDISDDYVEVNAEPEYILT
ncbi:hypothetical protein JUJ52_03055 [Virgibacillus sp. AGTR]|uniref:hypothetical protein n=1 Tax=Virgibacillus sp. AGTR TaxID=2812055 RepID=UPI001D16860A|nr:hypothetical protein [Virgibacillus sp. AGTR]MCC2248936.1 hypothetical protein [Virgibacillus sp. AGTR]